MKRLFVSLFFIFGVCSSLHARTLIFQSQSEPSPEQAVPPPVNVVAGADSAGKQYQTSDVARSQTSSAIATELLLMIEQLQQEVRSLRGLVEEQAYQLRVLQDNSKARYQDLDARVLALTSTAETGQSAGAAATSGSVAEAAATSLVVPVQSDAAQSNASQLNATKANAEPSQEQRLAYQQAYQLIKDRKFDQAVDALHAYIDKYPEGELTGNAYYWLGEVYLVLPKLEQARQSFGIVVKSFVGHRKLPDALFKLAVTHDRLQERDKAEQLLNRLQADYPNTTAAKLAGNYKLNR